MSNQIITKWYEKQAVHDQGSNKRSADTLKLALYIVYKEIYIVAIDQG